MRILRFLSLALVLVLGSAGLAHADQLFSTPLGATLNGQSVSAQAIFSVSGSTLTLKLSNTESNIQDAGQLLTGIFFTLSGPGSLSLSSQLGDLVNLGSGGVVTNLGIGNLGWGFGGTTLSGESGFELCMICQGGVTSGVTPTEGILGPVSADGKYDNANASLLTGAHNPLIEGPATYTFTGIPAGVNIDDVTFSFSTTPGGTVSAPEPSSLLLMSVGLLGLIALMSYRKRLA